MNWSVHFYYNIICKRDTVELTTPSLKSQLQRLSNAQPPIFLIHHIAHCMDTRTGNQKSPAVVHLNGEECNKYETHPSCDSDLLIFPASFRRSPAAPVCFCLSDPARSTRFILLVLTLLAPSAALCIPKSMTLVGLSQYRYERPINWNLSILLSLVLSIICYSKTCMN